MKKLLVLTVTLTSLHAWAAAPLCEDVFNGNHLEAQFAHVQQTLVLEDLRPQEQRLAYDLMKDLRVSPEKFLTRYKELQLLTTNEIAMSAPPAALLRLTATSLKKNFEVARVKSYLGVVLVQTKGYLEGDQKAYRIAIPHRVSLALTELAIATGRSAGDIAFTFTQNLKNLSRTAPAIDTLLTPPDQALANTRAEIASEK